MLFRSDHEEDMQGIENINQVYILDTTKEFKDINMYIDSYEDISEVHPDFTKIEFKEVDGEMNLSDAMEDISAEDDRLLIHIERQEDGILLQALLPEETLINEDESWELVDKLSQIIETYKKANSELTGEQIMACLPFSNCLPKICSAVNRSPSFIARSSFRRVFRLDFIKRVFNDPYGFWMHTDIYRCCTCRNTF